MFQRLHVCVVSKMNLTNSDLYFFLLCCGRLHWVSLGCVTCGIFLAIFLFYSVLLITTDGLSSLLIHPFYIEDKVHGDASTLLRLAHWAPFLAELMLGLVFWYVPRIV